MCSPASSSKAHTRSGAHTTTGMPSPNVYKTRPSAPGVGRLNPDSHASAPDAALAAVALRSTGGARESGAAAAGFEVPLATTEGRDGREDRRGEADRSRS